MAAVLTMDTLSYANKLKNAGVPSPFAEAQTEALSEILSNSMSDLATKEDLRATQEALRETLERKINDTKQELKQEINEVRQDLRELAFKTETSIAEVKRDTKELEARLITRMDGLETKITVKIGAMLATGIAILSTLIIILHKV